MSEVFLQDDWFPKPLPHNVRIGQRSWLYSSYAFARYHSRRPMGVEIGNDTGLYIGTVFDLGPKGEVQIGNYCTLVATVICCNSRIVIHDYAFLAHEVVLADHFAAHPFHQVASTEPEIDHSPTETSIEIGENTWIGGNAILLRGAKIGDGSIVGAAAVVDFEVPPYSIVAGNPARIIRRFQ